MTQLWEITEALKCDIRTLKDQICASYDGQPVPGSLSVDACRFALVLKGEDPRECHDAS